jgi:peptidoglycan/LPS O-acetylase OafA/YrhL
MTTKYRPDIDGLRAVAVLAVVVYHAFPETLPGGFVGVDAFFVISGFLITGIITDGLRNGTFTFRDFYARRIRRIFPALMVVLVACWLIGVFVLWPEDLRSLGRHLMSGAGMLSNFIFWKEAGYFDIASDAKPLLHLWSLAVEEQFYLVWPLLLFASWSRFRGWLALVVIIGAGSLALCVINTPTSKAAATFYLPPTRAWEFMIGAALAHPKVAGVRLPSGISNASSWLGLALLGSSILLLHRGLPYPGWRALLPTLGTALVIAAGPHSFCNRRLLSWRALVSVGLISYPLYLWHWPLLSYSRIASDGEVSVAARVSVVAISVVLADLTYRLVETPLRRSRSSPIQRTKTVALIVTGLVVMTLGAFTYKSERLQSIADAHTKKIRDTDTALIAKHRPQRCAEDPRLVGSAKGLCEQYGDVRGRRLLVVWGDSHAAAWTPVLLDIASQEHAAVYIFSHPGCPPLLHVRRSDGIGNAGFCSEFGYAEDILSSIQALKPDVVVLVARWSLYANGFRPGGHLAAANHFVTTSEDGVATQESSRAALATQLPHTIDGLLSASARVVVFKSPPQLRTLTRGWVIKRTPGMEPSLGAHRAAESIPDTIIERLTANPRVRVFDPSVFLCTSRCSAFVDGVPFYKDDNHPTAQGSFKLRDKLEPYLRLPD